MTERMQTSVQAFSQETQRQKSLVTPVPFSVALGTSSTTIYTAREGEFFLLRKFVIANTTGSSSNLTLTVGGDTFLSSEAIAANTTVAEDGLEGFLIDDTSNLAGLGSVVGLRAFGWGIRVQGGDGWAL